VKTGGGHDGRRSDEELIRAIEAGDSGGFDALYYRYRDWVVGLAHRFTGNADDALDVLQETFSYLIRKFPGFVLTARMTTFLYPVVKNLSLAARRKRGRFAGDEEVLLQLPAAPGEDPRRWRGELAQVMSALPGTHREVVLMRFVDGMSLEEIGEALGIPLGTVKSRMHNALNTLRGDERTRNYFLGQ
jgi:RNA polymerase sigma-70 factor (ECF subfamily)